MTSALTVSFRRFLTLDDLKGGTRDVNVAKAWMKEGKNVYMRYSYMTSLASRLKPIQTLCPIDSIEVINNTTKVVSSGITYSLVYGDYGTLYDFCFLNETKKACTSDYDIKANKEAFLAGDTIKVETLKIISYPIVAFIDDNFIETSDGYMYQLKPNI